MVERYLALIEKINAMRKSRAVRIDGLVVCAVEIVSARTADETKDVVYHDGSTQVELVLCLVLDGVTGGGVEPLLREGCLVATSADYQVQSGGVFSGFVRGGVTIGRIRLVFSLEFACTCIEGRIQVWEC